MASLVLTDASDSDESEYNYYSDSSDEEHVVSSPGKLRRQVSYQINNTEEMNRLREEKVAEIIEVFKVEGGVARMELLHNGWDTQRTCDKLQLLMEGGSVCNANRFHESSSKTCELCLCGNQKRGRGEEKIRKQGHKRAKTIKKRPSGVSLLAEIQKITRTGMFEVAAVQDRMTELRLTFIGPLGSLWEGQRCSFVVSLNENFPFTRPQSIAGDTSLEHPNICPESGNVCLGVVENWNPQTGLIGVGNALIELFRNPNWERAVNSDSAAKYRENKEAFFKMLKQKGRSNATAGSSRKPDSMPTPSPDPGAGAPSPQCGEGSATYSLKCEHYFCKTCWNKYIKAKLGESGPDFIRAPCMAQDCEVLINENLINFVCDEPVQLEYKKYFKRSIIERNRQCKHCPSPHCNLVVFYPEENNKTKKIVCKCGETFCWGCTKKCHAPVTCQMVETWGREGKQKSDLIKDNLPRLSERIMATCQSYAEERRESMQRRQEDIQRQQRELERRLLELAGEAEAATSNFLESGQYGEGAKPCPNCRKPTYKIDGCNHMTCRRPEGCGHQYCWVCLKDYGPQAGQCNSHCRNRQSRLGREQLHLEEALQRNEENMSAENSFRNIFNEMSDLVHVPVYDRTLEEFQAIQRLQINVKAKCSEVANGVPRYSCALQQIQESITSSLDIAMWVSVSRYFAGKRCTNVSTNAGEVADILPALNNLLRTPAPQFMEGFTRLRNLADRLDATHRIHRAQFELENAKGPDAPATSKITVNDLVINETLLRAKLAERERAETEMHDRERRNRELGRHGRGLGHPRQVRPNRAARVRVFPEHRQMTLVQMIQELVRLGFPEETITCRNRMDLQNLIGHATHRGLTAEMLARAKINFAAERASLTSESVSFREIYRSRVPISTWAIRPETLARSKRNFASHFNRPLGSVTIADLHNSTAGIQAWSRFVAIAPPTSGSSSAPNTNIDQAEGVSRSTMAAVPTGTGKTATPVSIAEQFNSGEWEIVQPGDQLLVPSPHLERPHTLHPSLFELDDLDVVGLGDLDDTAPLPSVSLDAEGELDDLNDAAPNF